MSDSGFYSRRTVWTRPPQVKRTPWLSIAAGFGAGFLVVFFVARNESVQTRFRDALKLLLAADAARLSEAQLQSFVMAASQQHQVPAGLIWAMIAIESDFHHRALSERGAMGLMQLRDGTARELNVQDPYDPAQNIDAGTRYISSLIKRYKGRTDLALAAYNAGPEAVKKYRGIPPFPETKRYVVKVLDEFKRRAGST